MLLEQADTSLPDAPSGVRAEIGLEVCSLLFFGGDLHGTLERCKVAVIEAQNSHLDRIFIQAAARSSMAALQLHRDAEADFFLRLAHSAAKSRPDIASDANVKMTMAMATAVNHHEKFRRGDSLAARTGEDQLKVAYRAAKSRGSEEDIVSILLQRAVFERDTGRLQLARKSVFEAIEFLEKKKMHRHPLMVSALASSSDIALLFDEVATASLVARQALELGRASRRDDLSRPLLLSAASLIRLGDAKDALDAIATAKQNLDDDASDAITAKLLAWEAGALWQQDEKIAATASLIRGHERLRDSDCHDDPESAAEAHFEVGAVSLRIGETEQARETFERGLQCLPSETGGLNFVAWKLRAGFGLALHCEGRFAAEREQMKRAAASVLGDQRRPLLRQLVEGALSSESDARCRRGALHAHRE